MLVVVITTSGLCYAISNHSFYELALTILSYSKWPNTTRPTICVIDNPEATNQFQASVKELSYDSNPNPLSTEEKNILSSLKDTKDHNLQEVLKELKIIAEEE